MLGVTCYISNALHNILESARNRKQSKVEYLQLLAEFDRLSISSYYETQAIEISALGHYQPTSIGNYLNFIKFSNPTITIPKSTVRKCLDDAAYQSILASERIFLARNNKEWLDVTSIS